MNPLKERIIELSTNQDWEAARNEWSLTDTYISSVFQKCLCGHYPIKEICEIHNPTTDKKVTVGNCCVKKVFNMESERIFRNIRKCIKDESTLLTDFVLDFAFKNNLIDAIDKHFYYEMRKLVKKKAFIAYNQAYKMKFMHTRILNKFKR